MPSPTLPTSGPPPNFCRAVTPSEKAALKDFWVKVPKEEAEFYIDWFKKEFGKDIELHKKKDEVEDFPWIIKQKRLPKEPEDEEKRYETDKGRLPSPWFSSY